MATENDLNLTILWQQHRMTEQARNGYEELTKLIRGRKHKKLDHLLRNHEAEEVTAEETYIRDDIDQLINAYMVLMVSMLAGRVSADLPTEIVAEISEVLGNPVVQRYYMERYPLTLPQVLYATVTDARMKQRVMSVAARIEDPSIYDDFMSIDREVESDEDIDSFLGLMDDYTLEGKTFRDLLKLLADPVRLTKKLSKESKEEDILCMAANGLLKYIGIIEEYRELLEVKTKNPFLASAFWHKQGYWFDGISKDFGPRLYELLHNLLIATTLVEPSVDDIDLTSNDKERLMFEASDTAVSAMVNLDHITRMQWKLPLLELLHGRGPLGSSDGGGKELPVSGSPVDIEFGRGSY